MSVTQTVDIPASRRLTIEVPREIPSGRAILTFTPVAERLPVTTKKIPVFGCAKGQFRVSEDFDAPLDDFKEYM
jgi:hypothetical protein